MRRRWCQTWYVLRNWMARISISLSSSSREALVAKMVWYRYCLHIQRCIYQYRHRVKQTVFGVSRSENVPSRIMCRVHPDNCLCKLQDSFTLLSRLDNSTEIIRRVFVYKIPKSMSAQLLQFSSSSSILHPSPNYHHRIHQLSLNISEQQKQSQLTFRRIKDRRNRVIPLILRDGCNVCPIWTFRVKQRTL